MDVFYAARHDHGLTDSMRQKFGRAAPQQVKPFFSLWPEQFMTPLINLNDISEDIGIGEIYLKDEGCRLGMGSFKALGGAYAVMKMFRLLLERKIGKPVTIPELVCESAKEFAKDITFCCATDGNHGKSVAAGARLIGCSSVIFVHRGVSEARAEAIGATKVIRVNGNYDASVEEATRVSKEQGWVLVSDTSWEGYRDVPDYVAQGYTVLAEEVLAQLSSMGKLPPTHVFLQAGVGGFASSVSAYLVDRLGRQNIRTIIVEPESAACLLHSAARGELTTVPSAQETIMAMLECYTPSLNAWNVLGITADAYMSISDDDCRTAMKLLAKRQAPWPRVVAGESGAAGLAGLLKAAKRDDLQAGVGLGRASRVLVVNTEYASDPARYTEVVGATPEEISAKLGYV